MPFYLVTLTIKSFPACFIKFNLSVKCIKQINRLFIEALLMLWNLGKLSSLIKTKMEHKVILLKSKMEQLQIIN